MYEQDSLLIDSAELFERIRASGLPEHETQDVLHPDSKMELTCRHYKNANDQPAPEDWSPFIEIGSGRVYIYLGSDGTLVPWDADDRVSYFPRQEVRVWRTYPCSRWSI